MPNWPITIRVKLTYNHRKEGDDMADYKEMYLKMVRASEKAINTLIDVQIEFEEMCIESVEAAQAEVPLGDGQCK